MYTSQYDRVMNPDLDLNLEDFDLICEMLNLAATKRFTMKESFEIARETIERKIS